MTQPDPRDVEIAQLKWALTAIVLRCEHAESEATVVLPANAIGVYAGFRVDVDITEGDEYAAVVHVKVHRIRESL